jgi:outer membrane lipoprotein SlyB
MYKLSVVASTMLGIFFLSSCANSNHVDHQAKNQFVTEFYAWVENVEKIKFKSYVGEGAAIGAVDGLLSNTRGNSQDMLAGGIIGGLFGGLLTALFEGNTNGYEYQLAAVDGDIVSVIVEDKAAEQGQCVSVRVAGDVRMRLESMNTCEEAAKEYPQRYIN